MATFHINRGGTNLGTFSEDEVRDGLRSGKFFGTDLGWREGMFPETENVLRRQVCLPVHAAVSEEDVASVVEALQEACIRVKE